MIRLTKPMLLGGAVAVAMAAAIATALVIQQDQKTTQQNTAQRQAAVADAVQGIADSYKPDKPYASLPDTEKTKFLEQKAVHFGLPPGQQPTPEVLTNACLERRERELSGMIANNPEAIEVNRSAYNEAAKKTRDYCYQQYAVDGVIPHGDMPHSMAH